MVNALSDFLGGFQAGDEITSRQREQRQTNQLARLAPQVVTGDPQAYAQAAAINPKVASQYQESGDEIAKRARGAAKYLQTALQSGNQQQIMAARQTIKPFMDTLKPGSSYPLDMDPMQEAAGLQGFLAQTSYIDEGGGASRVQSTYINRAGQRVAIMRDGRQQLLGEADARTQLRDQEGISPSIVDLRTGAATPLNEGGQPPQQQMPSVYIDPSLPPEVQAQIRQAEATGGQVPGKMFINRGGQGTGVAAARPDSSQQITAYQQAQLSLDQQRLEESRSQRQTELDRKNNPAPRELAQGEMSLRKEFQDQTKNSGVIINSYNQIKQAATSPSAQNDLALIFGYMRMLDPTSVVREGEFANAQNAAGVPDRIQNAYNRLLRGERLNPDQRQGFVKSADGIAALARQQVDQARNQYREMAGQYGYDPARIVGQQPGANVGNARSQTPTSARPQAAAGQQSSSYSDLWK